MALAQFGVFSARQRDVVVLTYDYLNQSAATAVGTEHSS